jgi:nucleotidyltransferase/DNA polymerase involved in DNA repair
VLSARPRHSLHLPPDAPIGIEQAYLDVTAAATALLRAEAAAAAAAAPPPDPPAHPDSPVPQPLPPLPPGSFEGWHVAGGGGGGSGGAAEWWARPAGEWGADERLLAAGARVVATLREAVERQLGFTCSAGAAPPGGRGAPARGAAARA